jgi:hypothetical protein
VFQSSSEGERARIQLDFGPFSEVEGVNLTLTSARLTATNVTFRNCVFTISNGGWLDLDACVLDGTVIALNGGTDHRVAMLREGSPIVNNIQGWVTLKGSVLRGVKMSRREPRSLGEGLDSSFQLEQCTVYGPTALPAISVPNNFQEHVKKNNMWLKACKFVDCSLMPQTIAISEDCVFEACRPDEAGTHVLIPGVKQRPITAMFLPRESANNAMASFSQFRFTFSSNVQAGSQLAHIATPDKVELSGRPINSEQTLLTSVLPPTTQPMAMVPAGGVPKPVPVPDSPAFENPFTETITGTAGAADCGLRSQQTSVNGLLIMSLASGEAGSASRMSAVALPLEQKQENAFLSFNQPVGETMGKALQEVAKFTQLNHGGWPKGHSVEISFADKYVSKDGPSAAVACSLLLHSLITGQELDPAFAVTGDMNADGSVQPIGGVAAKIRGATKGHCKLIGIPSKNESALSDVLLIDGPAPFASIQIFSIEKFSDAEALALTVKPENTTLSILEMNKVQEVLMRNPAQMGAWLKNQHVVAKLQQILKDTPNHLSAKYLLMYASGRVPQTLSLAGSLTAIDNTAGDLIGAIKANKGDAFDSMGKSSIGSTLTRLQTLRARCDVRSRSYADAIITFGTTVKEALDRPAQTSARQEEYRNRIRGAASSVESELSRLLNDPAVREELEG